MPYQRGEVYFIRIPGVAQGEEKPWLIVSNNHRNRALDSAFAVRITTTQKPPLASIVPLSHLDPVAGVVLCDSITEVFDDDPHRPAGSLSITTMRAVNNGLCAALGIPRS